MATTLYVNIDTLLVHIQLLGIKNKFYQISRIHATSLTH